MTSQSIFNINFNINKIAKNINCFVLLAPTSVIYKDKTSIKQMSTQSVYVPLFCPNPIQSNPMSITEAGQGPLFPSLSKNLKYKTQINS